MGQEAGPASDDIVEQLIVPKNFIFMLKPVM
jgi:hypothetical protein